MCNEFPKFILESLGLISLSFLSLILIKGSEEPKNVIPIIGAIALGMQRLLPTLQQIYSSWVVIGTNSADLIAILEALREAGALRAQMIII